MRPTMIQLTIEQEPDYPMDTQYGTITYKKWIELEEKRIKQNPTRITEIRKKKGKLSLWVNKVA